MAENSFINIKNLYININDISLIEKIFDSSQKNLIGLRVFIKGINKYINLAVSDLSKDLSLINILDELKNLIPPDTDKDTDQDANTGINPDLSLDD